MKGFGKLPDPIENAPELWPWLHKFYRCFEELYADRINDAMGGVGYIPWSSIDRYYARHSVLFTDFAELLYYVRALDFRYVKLIRDAQADKARADRAKRKQEASRPPKPSGRRHR